MSRETDNDSNTQPEDGIKGEVRAEGQQAKSIVNVGANAGGINIANATFVSASHEKSEIRIFNNYLRRNLMEAIKEYSTKATDFLKNLGQDDQADWEIKNTYTIKSNRIITSAFIGVLGVLLRKLISSGDKNEGAKNPERDYLELCTAIVERTLQLLCYIFISSLWEHAKDEKKYEMKPEQASVINNFFNTRYQLKITAYVELFKTLVAVFKDNNLDYPIGEIKTIEDKLEAESDFLKSCSFLHSVNEKLNQTPFILSSTDEAEKELTSFLTAFNFLVNYKMVSVKNVVYEKVRNYKEQYMRAYTLLELDIATNNYKEKFQYDNNKLLNSNAILLYRDKNKYQDGLDLFPFIIDDNVLKDEKNAKICFYSNYDEEDDDNEKTIKKLVYSHIEEINSFADDSKNSTATLIKYNEEIEARINSIIEGDITAFREEGDKFYAMKQYEVFKIFQKARETVLAPT